MLPLRSWAVVPKIATMADPGEETAPAIVRVRPLRDEPEVAIGSIDNVLVVVTREPPTLYGIRTVIEESRALLESHPDGFVLVVAPRAKQPRLSSEAGEALKSGWRSLDERMLGAGIWIRSDGFTGALQRSLVTTVLLMRRTRAPTKVVGNALDLAQWIGHTAPIKGRDPVTLKRALEQFVSASEPK